MSLETCKNIEKNSNVLVDEAKIGIQRKKWFALLETPYSNHHISEIYPQTPTTLCINTNFGGVNPKGWRILGFWKSAIALLHFLVALLHFLLHFCTFGLHFCTFWLRVSTFWFTFCTCWVAFCIFRLHFCIFWLHYCIFGLHFCAL